MVKRPVEDRALLELARSLMVPDWCPQCGAAVVCVPPEFGGLEQWRCLNDCGWRLELGIGLGHGAL